MLFQFGKKTGWPLAEQLGTITPHQVWVASSKTERADYDAAKVCAMACAYHLDCADDILCSCLTGKRWGKQQARLVKTSSCCFTCLYIRSYACTRLRLSVSPVLCMKEVTSLGF